MAARRGRRQFLGGLSAGAALALASPSLRAQAMDRKLGVALVGLGGYSTGQLGPALKATKHCRLAGVVTGSREKGLAWSKDYGFPEANVYSYDTMARIADSRDIDIVYIVTPPGLHAGHAIAAANTGKHVICEKPMAVSVAECDAIIAACKSAGVELSIGYRLHFDPLHEEVRRLARTKDFGAFTTMSGAFAFPMGRMQWRAQKKLAGGGPLMDLGIYVVQESCMAAGANPVAVTARERPKKRPEFFADVEESIDWTLEFADGAKATGFTSYNEGGNRFRAEAPKGWIELAPSFNYGGNAGSTSKGPIVFTAVNQQAEQMDDFALCLKQKRATRVPGAMGRRDIVITTAIYASAAAGGARVPIDPGLRM